jgi:hypothetical protein
MRCPQRVSQLIDGVISWLIVAEILRCEAKIAETDLDCWMRG